MKYALTEGAKRVGGGVNLGHSLSPPSHFMLATGLIGSFCVIIEDLCILCGGSLAFEPMP